MTELDLLLESARAAMPSSIDDPDRDRLLVRAAAAGRARHRAWARRRLYAAAAIGGALAVTVLLIVYPRPRTEPPRAQAAPLELELPTGDAITATAGTRFSVEEATRGSRRIRVRSGTVLFEVQPLHGDERFEVVTSQLRAVVVGTVFSVEATQDATTVRVYEGRVRIAEGRRSRELRTGDTFVSGDSLAPERGPLEAEGIEAARARRIAAPAREQVPAIVAARDSAAVVADTAAVVVRPEPIAPPDASELRRRIADGDGEAALSIIRTARRRGATADPWALLEGDALRALRRFDESARVYEAAIDELQGERRAQAGFLAASLYARDLEDAEKALELLEASGADVQGSPLRERALALEWELYGRLARSEERRRIAEAYLREFPDGSRADELRAWLER